MDFIFGKLAPTEGRNMTREILSKGGMASVLGHLKLSGIKC